MIPRAPRLRLLLLLLGGLTAVSGVAVERLGLEIQRGSVGPWHVDGLRLRLAPKDDGALGLKAEAAVVDAPFGTLQDVELACPRLSAADQRWRCPGGDLRASHPELGHLRGQFELDYAGPGRLQLVMSEARVLGAAGQGRLRLSEGDWSVELSARGLALARLAGGLGYGGELAEAVSKGQAELSLQAGGSGVKPRQLEVDIQVKGLDLANTASTRVGQGLDLSAHLEARRTDGRWGFDGRIGITAGQAYAEPVFLEVPSGKGLTAEVEGTWQPGQRLVLERLQLVHPDVASLQASGELELAPSLAVERAQARLKGVSLPAAYRIYAQPFLIGTALDELQTSGRLKGAVRYAGGELQQLSVGLDDVHAEDRGGLFAAYGLAGELAWRRAGEAASSRLRMEGGYLYGLPLGEAEVHIQALGGHLGLSQPAIVPIFDGALEIRSLQASGLGSEDLRWQFDALLTPVSLSQVSHTLGWPLMSGKLSGMIPNVRYVDEVLEVGGKLLVRVFDGRVVIADLRLAEPLGRLPRLTANVTVDRLDLARLTRTFDFGRIQGQLSGHVSDLRLVAWEPVHFDAELMTPPDDPTRHRISQRAVDNLTRLGNAGIAGALSGTFLQFFEQFPYDRLGLTCRLRQRICHMGGVAPADGGYYIVKGGGIPRIDVIGHTRKVDWKVLVKRLRNIRLEGEPVIR